MIKKLISFDDFDGNPVTEEHYFHLSKMELMDMEFSTEGGMAAQLQKIMNSGKASEIMDTFKKIIADSYGIRESNTKFTKDPAVTATFMTSPAFDAFYEELLTDPMAAANFINGVVPKDLAAQIDMDKVFAESGVTVRSRPVEEVPLPSESELDNEKRIVTPGYLRGITPNNPPAPVPPGTPSTTWEQDKVSGLAHPRDDRGQLLPWALRAPTQRELLNMSQVQLIEVTMRMNRGWKPAEEPSE